MCNHYELLQEFLLVFYILDYKYHEQLLHILQYNDNELLLYGIFHCHHQTKSFLAYFFALIW